MAESKAVKILREIVAQWEGAEWCDEAVEFLRTYQPDESARFWKCVKCNAEDAECDECGGTGRADCAQIELRSRLNDASKHSDAGLRVKFTKDYAITPGPCESYGANVSAATRSDSVVADGVTAGETALYCSHCGTWMGDAEWLAKYKDTARCWQCASKGKGLQPNTECRHGVSIGDHCPDCEAMRGAEN
jgi:hypothetical protein